MSNVLSRGCWSFSNFFSSSFGELSFCINLMASICICTGMAAAKGRGNHLRIFVKTPEYPLCGLVQIAGQIVYSACIQSMVILYELAACAKSWCAVV